MNTKKFFFILSAVFFSFALQGQALINPAIQAKLNTFIEYSNSKEWDKVFDLMYPKLFTKVAKQDLVDLMLGMEADGMDLRMTNARVTSTSVPVVEGNETFVRVEYTGDMYVSIEANGMYDSPKAIQAIDEQLKATYGKQNVKLDQSIKQYQILASKSIMAIQIAKDDWKLVEINMDQPELMEFLFSPSVMDALVRVE